MRQQNIKMGSGKVDQKLLEYALREIEIMSEEYNCISTSIKLRTAAKNG